MMGEVEKKTKKQVNWKLVAAVVLASAAMLAAVVLGVHRVMDTVQQSMQLLDDPDDALFTVENKDVKQEITTSGTVVGIDKQAYVSPVTAKVDRVMVEAGQTVQKGDVLLTYDASQLGDDLAKVRIQAQSDRAAGNASYETANEAAGKA